MIAALKTTATPIHRPSGPAAARELESHGIQVTALNSHMLRETPRLFFMHFWGLDEPARIAEGLKAALGKVAAKAPEKKTR